MDTKKVGNTAELEVLCWLAKHGYSVSLPFGDNSPYDIMAESLATKKVYRIQVRSSTWKNGVLSLGLRSSSHGKARVLDMARIEAFIVWDGLKLYIVPTHAIASKRGAFSLRNTEPKNGQKQKINAAIDYESDTSYIP